MKAEIIQKICDAAEHEMRQHFELPEKFQPIVKLDPSAQLNHDGSLTYCMTYNIDGVIHDIEVYHIEGEYTADCWRSTNGAQYHLLLHNHR